MMRNLSKRLLPATLLAAVLALSACGERDQATTTHRGLVDEKAWQGAHNAYVAPGWIPGDKTSWENHLRARGQAQNESLKTN